MTEEELRKEATSTPEWECAPMIDRPLFVFAYVKGALLREKHIAELEKENAKLRTKLKPENCLKLLAKEGYIKFTSDQLAKAKKIIKTFLGFAEAFSYSPSMDKFITEAEQFLKEVSE